MPRKMNFGEFEKKAILPFDEISAIYTIDPISTRLAYFIYKKNIKISPNNITWFRLLVQGPLIFLFLFLAPFLQIRTFYLISAIMLYLVMLSDALDGHLARGADRRSASGGFLDIISDRIVIIIFIASLFSIGMFEQNLFLIYGSTLLFVVKIYNMTVINKVYYFEQDFRDKTVKSGDLFSGLKELDTIGISKVNAFFVKLNKYLKVKRWCQHTGSYERNLITIALPYFLVFFGFDMVAIVLCSLFVILFSYFYISRTRNLIKNYEKKLNKN